MRLIWDTVMFYFHPVAQNVEKKYFRKTARALGITQIVLAVISIGVSIPAITMEIPVSAMGYGMYLTPCVSI